METTGEQMMIKIMMAIWMYIMEKWKFCNTHLHQHADQLNLTNNKQAVIT